MNIVVCGKKDVWDLPYHTSAAIENMLLMITGLGLGACWVIAPCIDIRDEERLKALLEMPEGFKAISILSRTTRRGTTDPVPACLATSWCSTRSGALPTTGKSHEQEERSQDYANSLSYDLQKAFWDERGKGRRVPHDNRGVESTSRTGAVRGGFQSADLDHILATITEVIKGEGIAEEVEYSAEGRLSVSGSGDRSAGRREARRSRRPALHLHPGQFHRPGHRGKVDKPVELAQVKVEDGTCSMLLVLFEKRPSLE